MILYMTPHQTAKIYKISGTFQNIKKLAQLNNFKKSNPAKKNGLGRNLNVCLFSKIDGHKNGQQAQEKILNITNN